MGFPDSLVSRHRAPPRTWGRHSGCPASIGTSFTPSVLASATNSQPYAEAVAVAHEFLNGARVHLMLSTGRQVPCLQLQIARRLKRDRIAPHAASRNVAEFATPEQRRSPVGVMFDQGLRPLGAVARELQVRSDVAVDNDHCRSSRPMASMSFARNFAFGSAARSARALASRSLTATRPGVNTDTRQTIASLIRLRRWFSAEALSRWYTSSGVLIKGRVELRSRPLQTARKSVSGERTASLKTALLC